MPKNGFCRSTGPVPVQDFVCEEVKAFMRRQPESPFDVVFVDPPYS